LGELPVASELGFNIIEVSTGPNSVFPNSDTPTREPLAIDYNDTMQTGKITDVLDKCAKLGLKIDLGLTMHFMPKWFFEKYPDAKNNSPNFMMPYDIEHPEVRKLTDKFYDYVMPLIAHHPALNSIWVVNEPGYMNPNERNMAIFRPWLQEKYKTVAGLNAAWGTTLKSFDEVAAGKERAYIPNGVTTAAAQADWWRYTSERVTLHFQHMRDLVHKYDPELPVSVKLFNATFNPQFKPPMRVNEEPVFDSMAYMGYDGGSYPFSKSYKDFIRSLNPDKPMGNLEYKFGAQRSPIDFWQEAMQGAALINWWCWHPKYTFSPAPSYARALYYAAIEMQDIQRLLPQIMAFNKGPRAPMALLYPNPAISFDREYFNVSQGVNETLTWMGYNVDYVSEKRVAQGRLDDYRAIIMPSANYIQDETYQKVQAFIAKGGTAIVLGALPEHDELGHARNADFFKSTTNKALDMDGAKAYVYSAGKGTIYHLPELPRVPSSNNANKLSDSATPIIKAYLETTLQQSVPQQPVVIRNCENRTVAYKDEKGEKVYLTYLVNDSFDNELVVQPKFNFKVKSARDLISTRQVNPNKIVLAPLTVMMVRFTIAK
jgi:hypothetical protein